MHKRSLAAAKAHLSHLVDQAEHKGKRIIILRHGVTATAIVPVAVAAPPAKSPGLTPAEIENFFDDAERQGDPSLSAVEDLDRSRR